MQNFNQTENTLMLLCYFGVTILVMKRLVLFLILLSTPCYAAHLYTEKQYQTKWCAGKGIAEFVLPDNTRVDCLTKTHAIEFDFANKWAESIGQSLYYSIRTGKKAGVVLIMENKQRDEKYLKRLQRVAKRYCIDVWVISPESM